ncbi:MAG: hypothetical protein ABIO21_04525 [Pseudomonas sp.]
MSDTQKDDIDLKDGTLWDSPVITTIYSFFNALITEEDREFYRKLSAEHEEKRILNEALERKKNEQNAAVDQVIKTWWSQKNPDRTRVIIKVINNTRHALNVTQSSIRMSAATIENLAIPANESTTFKFDRHYEVPEFSRKTQVQTQFKYFFDYANEDVGFQFDVGLTVEGAYSSAHGHWNDATRLHAIASSGKTPIQCTSKVTRSSKVPPFNFEVLIKLD